MLRHPARVLRAPLCSLVLFGALACACNSTGVGTGSAPSPAASSPPPSASGDADAAIPATLYATYDKDVAPSYFFDPSASSFAAGFTIITANTVEQPEPDSTDTLPTELDLTLKFPSAIGTYDCASGDTVAVELDATYDSNSNLRQVGTTSGPNPDGTCTITVTAIDEPSGRLTGTFETNLTTGQLSGGAFDVPYYAAP